MIFTGRFCPVSSASAASHSKDPVLRPGEKKIGGGMERNRMVRAAALALLASNALPSMSPAQSLADAMVSAVQASTDLEPAPARGHIPAEGAVQASSRGRVQG